MAADDAAARRALLDTATSESPRSGSRLTVYGSLNVAFLLLMLVGVSLGSDPNLRLLYLALLFAVCSSPALFVRKLNDRYATYAIFLLVYFVSYGVMDIFALVMPASPLSDRTTSESLLTPSEVLIILGGVALICGYQVSVARALRRGASNFVADDWPLKTLVAVGLLLWGAGTYANWYWNIRLTVRSLEFNLNIGQWLTTLLMMGRYAQPLGILILAYAAATSRAKALWVTVIIVTLIQVALGFVTNTKIGAMLGGILVIVASHLVTGKIPKAWVIGGLLFISIAFPILQAYRVVVVGEQGLTNAEAAQNVGQALQMAVEGHKRTADEGPKGFFDRSSVKSSVEMILNGTAAGVPFQNGHTLTPLITAFVPRLFWPDKPDVQTGLLVNEQFHVANAVVYISPSHLGEMYWNFGWVGAIVGMMLLGALLGWIGSLCDLSAGTSVTRVLIVAITIFQCGIRFEGSIASDYAIWMRSIVGILLMHWLFARRGLRHAYDPKVGQGVAAERANGVIEAPRRFSNLMT